MAECPTSQEMPPPARNKPLLARCGSTAAAREGCSPEQNSGWLEKDYPLDEAMRMISHETI